MARPGRRLRPGSEVAFPGADLKAVVEAVLPSGRRMVRFQGGAPLAEVLERRGHVPLPPYIRREDTPADRDRYQAVYAKTTGAVAAPTAGLHFTPELLKAVRDMGVSVTPILLHVGPGTFKPVEVEDPTQHRMDAEYYEVTPEAAGNVNATRRKGGRIVAVGTTSVRVLESCAEAGDAGWALKAGSGWTETFIYPPYAFRLVDALVTNFHLPRSTLLMLVSALAGREFVLRAYQEAVCEGYRFYSYGDAMLIH
jgi:S-adenosylmethionine:tRNA ribosyltransferase-isomerase